MAYSLNRAAILGNVVRTPSLKYTQSNTPVMNLCVATNESWKDKNTGEWQEEVEFHDCTLFGALAEAMNERLLKGQMVYVEGKIKTRKWEDKEGNERKSKDIIASLVVPYRLPKSEQPEEESPRRKPFTPPPAPPAEDDDLPF